MTVRRVTDSIVEVTTTGAIKFIIYKDKDETYTIKTYWNDNRFDLTNLELVKSNLIELKKGLDEAVNG